MGGRRVYHARGKVLGGSSSINGMIFQRGNPMDYERWAADAGMESWDYAHCLPYFRRMENCLAADADDEFRGHDGPLVLERGPATNPLFGAFLKATEEAGYAPTDDVNGYRQEGFAEFDRNVHRGRRLSASKAYLKPGDEAAQPHGHDPRPGHPRALRGQAGRRCGVPARAAVPCSRSAPGRSSCCGGAINSPQLLQLSGVGNAEELGALGIDVVAGSAGRRREHAGPPGGLRPVRLQAAGVDAAVHGEVARPVHRAAVALPQGPGGHQPLRGRRLRPQQRGRRLPQPDVPLPAHRRPLRRLLARRAGTATRCTWGRCTPTPSAR